MYVLSVSLINPTINQQQTNMKINAGVAPLLSLFFLSCSAFCAGHPYINLRALPRRWVTHLRVSMSLASFCLRPCLLPLSELLTMSFDNDSDAMHPPFIDETIMFPPLFFQPIFDRQPYTAHCLIMLFLVPAFLPPPVVPLFCVKLLTC